MRVSIGGCFVTNKYGQYRLIIVYRPAIEGEMHGILTTLQAGRGTHLTPVATPIVFVPQKPLGAAAFGRIGPGDACYAQYRGFLKRTVDEHFALFVTGG